MNISDQTVSIVPFIQVVRGCTLPSPAAFAIFVCQYCVSAQARSFHPHSPSECVLIQSCARAQPLVRYSPIRLHFGVLFYKRVIVLTKLFRSRHLYPLQGAVRVHSRRQLLNSCAINMRRHRPQCTASHSCARALPPARDPRIRLHSRVHFTNTCFCNHSVLSVHITVVRVCSMVVMCENGVNTEGDACMQVFECITNHKMYRKLFFATYL